MIKRLLPLFLFSLLLVMFTGCFEDDDSIPGAELEVSLNVNKSSVKTGEEFTFIAVATGGSDYKYEWKLNSDSWSDGSSVKSYTKHSSGSYKCEVRVTSGAKTGTATKTVRVEEAASQLSVSLKAEKPQVKPGESIKLNANVNADESGLSYFWKDGSGNWTEGSKSKTYNKSSEGSYTFYFKVKTPTQEKQTSTTVKVSSEEAPTYFLHTGIKASTFWAGENASGDNHNISNVPSAWDNKWGDNFGVEDYPYLSRDSDFIPTDHRFLKKENPYYFALPYNDYNDCAYDGKQTSLVASQSSDFTEIYDADYGRKIVKTSAITNLTSWDKRKASISRIPWRDEYSNSGWSGKSMVKARWIKLRHNGGRWCYAQWADAGPYYYDDVDYVFGESKPMNQRLNSDNPYAGIDLSPSVMLYLGVQLGQWGANIDNVDWQFVDESDVPEGPWKKYVSSNNTNWN